MIVREILFRGKRCDNGEWVQGCLVKFGKESFTDDDRYGIMDKTVLVVKTHKNHCGSLVFGYCDYVYHNIRIAEIIPKSVGQLTGLTDKNGKKIFEGDIIQYSIEEDQAVFVGAVKFGEFNPDGGALLNTNVGFYVELVDQEGKRTYMRKDIGYWVKFRGVEVIGNIHDNPELLEVK